MSLGLLQRGVLLYAILPGLKIIQKELANSNEEDQGEKISMPNRIHVYLGNGIEVLRIA